MFDKELKIGDYVFSLNNIIRGYDLARITKVNKTTYTATSALTGHDITITFDGRTTRSFDYYRTEWFYCDDLAAKTLELYREQVKKQYVKKLKELQNKLNEIGNITANKTKEFKDEIEYELDEEVEE